MNWYGIKRHVTEAERILKEYDLPFTYDDILDLNPEPKDECSAIAINIIVEYKNLQDEISKNRIERALDRLYSLCAMAEELWIHIVLPNDPRRKSGSKTRQTVFLENEIEAYLVSGFKAKHSKLNNGGHNKLPKELWQERANEIYVQGELKIKLATRVHQGFYCDEKEITIDQVNRHITKPK